MFIMFAIGAKFWKAIGRAIADKSRTIRLSANQIDKLKAMSTVTQRLVQQLGREPSLQEVAEGTGLPYEQSDRLVALGQRPVSLEQSGFLCAALGPNMASGQSSELMDAYNNYNTLYDQGRYSEAELYAKEALRLGAIEFGKINFECIGRQVEG